MRQGLPGINTAKVTPFTQPTKKNEEKFMEYKEFERIISPKRMGQYMFSAKQYRATGRSLLKIFPNKTRSSAEMQYNQSYVFNELDKVNTLRNRLAHHEPICFYLNEPEIDTGYIVTEYQKIQSLFAWMGIDSRAMLYGLDHVLATCSKINALKV